MSWKRSYPTDRTVKPGIRKRIFIPQPKERVLKLPAGDALRTDIISEDPWWFTIHKRGIRRPVVGTDPLEARAAPETRVKGYLHERVLYKFFNTLRMYEPGDFTFQSSAQGGRLELGGLVVDFLFESRRLCVQVQGPTHIEFLRMAKDREQDAILADMGYSVEYVELRTIRNEFELENWGRRVFGLGSSGGSGMLADSYRASQEDNANAQMMDSILIGLTDVSGNLSNVEEILGI